MATKISGNSALFIETFDRNCPLEEQVELPYIFHRGPDLAIEMAKGASRGFSITDGNKSVQASEISATYAVAFWEDKYLAQPEAWYAFHSDETFDRVVNVNICRLRKSIRELTSEKIVHTRLGKLRIQEGYVDGFPTGYYIGDIAEARNEEENFVQRNGFRLNTVTGCLTLPDKTVVKNLTGMEVFIVDELIRRNGRGTITDFARSVYNDESKVGTLSTFASYLRGKIGMEYLPRIDPGSSRSYRLVPAPV